jgi:hypothetical protein
MEAGEKHRNGEEKKVRCIQRASRKSSVTERKVWEEAYSLAKSLVQIWTLVNWKNA